MRSTKYYCHATQDNSGRSIYRCCEIVDVVETAKVYNIGKSRTNTGLRLKYAKQERVFRLEFISNQAFAPYEFAKWKKDTEEAGLQLPTKDFVHMKQREIKQALNYQYTSADIDAIIKRKEQFRDTVQQKYFGLGTVIRQQQSGVRYTATQLKSCDLLQKLAC